MAPIESVSIPIVDLSPFTSASDPASRKQAAKDLAKKGQINGCVGITGHGIPLSVLAEAFGVSKALFDLPYEEKMKAPNPPSIVPHRGYSGLGKESPAAKTALETDSEIQKEAYLDMASDCKESYEIGSEENEIQYNIWLPEDTLPGFRDFTSKLFWEMKKTADGILEALILSLDLTKEEAKTVRALHRGHDNQLRLLHYPPISTEMVKRKEVSRLGAHRDWSLFTLLFQDSNSGLEFLDIKSGDFITATPKEGVVYMNIGDMFQRLSNGLYPSALHRVTISGKETGKETPARYSIPYFVAPVTEAIVEPMPSLVAASGKAVYEPVTFASYSESMFDAIQKNGSEEELV